MSDLEIFEDFEQGSDEWFECRRGVPTASHFKDVLAKSDERYMRNRYRRRLAAERYSGEVLQHFRSADMDRGKVQEPLIRSAYAFMTGRELKQIAFARRGIAGCSPDSLIVGTKRGLEIKSANPDILFDHIDRDIFPGEHKAQCQGFLWVMEYEIVDIAIGYFPDPPPPRPYPLFIKTATRDEAYIAELAREVSKFDQEVGALVKRVEAYAPD